MKIAKSFHLKISSSGIFMLNILSHCNMKKLNWYLEKDMADLIDENTIKLRFELKKRNSDKENKDLYATSFLDEQRVNHCVVCGNDKGCMKYHVVPTIYRQNLPDQLKLHKSHDIVLLCLGCHERANKFADTLRENLANSFGIPTSLFPIEYQINNKTAHIIKLASTLLY